MEKDGDARIGAPRERHGVFARRVPEAGFVGELAGEQRRVMDQRVGAARELECGRVVGAPAILALAEACRAVIGHVGQRRVIVADSVSVCAPAAMGDLARQHAKALDLEHAGIDRIEAPAPPKLARRDREVRRRHRALEDRLCVARPFLERLGDPHVDARPFVVGPGEERQPHEVVPVQVAVEDRPGVGLAAEQVGHGPHAGSVSRISDGAVAPSWASATQEVCPP